MMLPTNWRNIISIICQQMRHDRNRLLDRIRQELDIDDVQSVNLEAEIRAELVKQSVVRKKTCHHSHFEPLPDLDHVESRLSLDEKTGIFTWKPWIHPSTRHEKAFNSRYAGREAGYASHEVYRVICLNNHDYPAHRLAWLCYYHFDPQDRVVDHITATYSNVRENLRIAPFQADRT